MTRQERRRLERTKPSELKAAAFMAASIVLLHESYGWGAKARLPKFADQLLEVLSDRPPEDLITEYERLTGNQIRFEREK